ncbi:NAD(P)-binding protein [Turneriella parva]|uniref:FAD dependent oxidoreductase n=1 Tax=Turneriella parva (strain ATCC BAA-1111 / DSM 21527 / NCTC 11395 / H) TaxID=869212 RepID=I4B4H1_TURPD|nr:NAD(P)-binding protein [Turneriella parva]AFM12178.1 FAD dependent oxidoreductase [Turneriella parva DSM 21527]
MKRRDYFELLWQQDHGKLGARGKIAIAGAGTSGLHLAYALVTRGFEVTVFDPLPFGGLRVPLMHACNTVKPRSGLWQAAAAWSRGWYTNLPFATTAVLIHKTAFGQGFTILARPYLRALRRFLKQQGVNFVKAEFDLAATGFVEAITAVGIASQPALNALAEGAVKPLPGIETYFGNVTADAEFSPEDQARVAVTTNYIRHGRRAGFIHRNNETPGDALAMAQQMYPTNRPYLFGGTRLTSRDRLPIVGRLPGDPRQPFFFTAMGYHAMTYAPFLATRVAQWLVGEEDEDRNLICGLTPARFLPRELIGRLNGTDRHSAKL